MLHDLGTAAKKGEKLGNYRGIDEAATQLATIQNLSGLSTDEIANGALREGIRKSI